MSGISREAITLATKVAAEQLKKSNHTITSLQETVATQAATLKEAAKKDRALTLATKLVAGDSTLATIQEKAASLLREDLDVVEKAMDLGLTQGLKLGHVVEDNNFTRKDKGESVDALTSFLLDYSNNS